MTEAAVDGASGKDIRRDFCARASLPGCLEVLATWLSDSSGQAGATANIQITSALYLIESLFIINIKMRV